MSDQQILGASGLPLHAPVQLTALFDNMPVLLLAVDDGGQLAAWSREAERCTGYSAGEMLATPVPPAIFISSDTERAGAPGQWTVFQGDFRDRELRLRARDGSIRAVSWTNVSGQYPIPGWASWVIGVDISRHVRSAARAERLQQVTAALSETVTLEQVADIIANSAFPTLGSDTGVICLLSEDGASLNLLAERGAPQELLRRFPDYPIDSPSAIAEAVRLRRPLWIPTPAAYAERYPALTEKMIDSVGSEAVAALPLILKGQVIGVIGFAFPRPQTFETQDRAFMLALVHQCAQALERAQLLRREAETREALQARIRQQSSIARLGLRALRADVQTLMNEIAVAVSEALGVEYVKVLELLDDGERFRLRAGVGWREGLVGRLIITAGAHSQAGYALLNEGPIIVNDLRTETRFEDPDMLMEHDVVSGMSVILETRNGPYGVLGAHTREQRVFTEDDIDFLQAAANILGEAIERDQIVRAEQEARRRAEAAARRIARLQALTVALSESLTLAEVARVVVEEGLATVGAKTGVFFQLVDEGRAFELVYSSGGTGMTDKWRRFEADPAYPVSQVVRTGQPLWFERGEDAGAQFPAVGHVAAVHDGASVVLPLMGTERALGAVSFTFDGERDFSVDDREFIMTIAHQSAQATERAQLYQAERAARLAAETADQLKLKFLAMVSHELRTPLTSIKGFISSLIATDVSWPEEQVREFLSIADSEADKLAALVEQLLDLSRLEAGTLAIQPEVATFTDVLAVAFPQLEILTERHNLRLDIAPDLPPIRVDPQRIAQVLANLVGNGAKYGPPATAITVAARPVDDHIRVDVSDEGDGIPLAQHEIVFEAFRQGDGRHGGAGLGLAICRGLVEAHGGEIWIADTDAPGATISFTLPVA